MEIRNKPCPFCGHLNNPVLLACAYCEADLSNVPIGTRIAAAAADNQRQESPLTADRSDCFRRFCECGHRNLANARKCQQCGEDISDILPTADQEKAAGFRLVAVEDEYSFEMTEAAVTIGRNAAMADYLKNRPYVSRIHARLNLGTSGLTVENLSRTNFTYVNNKLVASEETVALNEGDEIGLGGFNKDGSRQAEAAYFTIVKN